MNLALLFYGKPLKLSHSCSWFLSLLQCLFPNSLWVGQLTVFRKYNSYTLIFNFRTICIPEMGAKEPPPPRKEGERGRSKPLFARMKHARASVGWLCTGNITCNVTRDILHSSCIFASTDQPLLVVAYLHTKM